MKSSKPKTALFAKTGYLSNTPAQTLFAWTMPLALLTAFAFLLRQTLTDGLALPFAVPFPLVGGLIGAAVASLYCDFMKDVKSSRAAATVRGGILVLLASYLIASLFQRGVPMNRILLPSFHNISAAFGAYYTWNSVISLKKLFSSRKHFVDYTELHQGEQLKELIYAEAGRLFNTNDEISAAKKSFLLQLILLGFILLGHGLFRNPLPLFLYFLLAGILLCGVSMIGFLGIFKREQYYAGEGLTASPFDRLTHILGMGVFSALCIGIAALLSTGKNLLRISWVTDFFKWLFSLIRRPPKNIEAPPPPVEVLPPVPDDLQVALSVLAQEERTPWPVWTWLKYAIIVIAAAVFIWFMIEPLLNRGKRRKKMTIRQKLFRIIAEWFKGVLNGFTSFFAAIKRGRGRRKVRRPGAEEIRHMADSLMGAYTQARKSDIRRSATLFARLIIWGGEVRQMLWKPSHAPGEYCSLLSATASLIPMQEDTLKQQNENIIRCGALFEQALYSAEVLSDDERKEFKKLIEEITADAP